jgi:hypothetical protein
MKRFPYNYQTHPPACVPPFLVGSHPHLALPIAHGLIVLNGVPHIIDDKNTAVFKFIKVATEQKVATLISL